MLQQFGKALAVATAMATLVVANAAAAYTWLPAGQYYATGRETVATPGVAAKSCGAFWNLEVVKSGQLRVLEPGAPECGVTAYGLPWRVLVTSPTTAVVRNVWFQGTNETFCQGDLKLTLQAGGLLEMKNASMAAGCSMSATISTNSTLKISQ